MLYSNKLKVLFRMIVCVDCVVTEDDWKRELDIQQEKPSFYLLFSRLTPLNFSRYS